MALGSPGRIGYNRALTSTERYLMSERMWSVKDLGRFLRFEDPEVRCWAADRLMRHHPAEATDVIGPFLFDDHGTTQEMVADHLARHGGRQHLEQLAKGLRHLRGLPAARSLNVIGTSFTLNPLFATLNRVSGPSYMFLSD